MRIVTAILIILSLCSCAVPAPVSAEQVPEPELEQQSNIAETEPEPEPAEPEVLTFEVPAGLSPQETVSLYFEQLYSSYIQLKPADLSAIADFEHGRMMQNLQNWADLLALRRRVIFEHGFCYVDTAQKPYDINYFEEKELSDQRMDYIDLSEYGEGAVALHFVISGTPGEVYPPLFAVNSEHTVVLSFDGERYKVAYHYFPGSEGKFENDLDVVLITEEQMLATLYAEFADVSPEVPEAVYRRIYDGNAAVGYALSYCESQNPDFHFVGDWYGNCMNFASQCIWSGFAKESDTPKNFGGMTNKWYCGKAGGTLIWASVSRFWNWTQGTGCPMQTVTFSHVSAVQKGDLVNVAPHVTEEQHKFSHALIVVDDEKLIFAQNSPSCFIYYSDLVNCDFRFLRPISLNA